MRHILLTATVHGWYVTLAVAIENNEIIFESIICLKENSTKYHDTELVIDKIKSVVS